MDNGLTIDQQAEDLEAGKTTARELVEKSIANIAEQLPLGGPVFLQVDETQALANADVIDQMRKIGRAPSRYAGIPFSAKDLFDIGGQVTTAGSVVLKEQMPALKDCTAIARLKQRGFICLGRTNMTEFAYSGVGLNPHYGTPKSIWDRETGRIPGGSSAGAAVSVADGTCALGIGTDTGGSCRVPAAFNGLVGYKASLGRVPTDGVYPLATSFDTVGPLARTVQCCATSDAAMASSDLKDWNGVIQQRPLQSIRLGVLQTLVLDDLDDDVSMVFGGALTRLACSGVELVDVEFKELAQLPAINASGGIGASEAYQLHADLLARNGDEYDQRVRKRISVGANISENDLDALKVKRTAMIKSADQLMCEVDALIMPTTPHIAAAISDLDRDEDYGRINLLALRNTFVGNFLNRCAITVPAHALGDAPVGVMLMAPLMADDQLFAIARAVESVISPSLEK